MAGQPVSYPAIRWYYVTKIGHILAGCTTAGAELSVAADAGTAAPATAMVAARSRADPSFFIESPPNVYWGSSRQLIYY
jgi:hypothetical protein